MHVVRQGDGPALVQSLSEPLHADFDGALRLILPVQRVDRGMDDVEVEFAHGPQHQVVGGEVRGAHVRWDPADDFTQSVGQLIHLRDDPGSVERGEVRMTPAVRILISNEAPERRGAATEEGERYV